MATGNAELLGPPEVRDHITNFYWRMDGLLGLVTSSPPYRARLRSVMPYPVQAGIRARCDEVITEDSMGMATPRLPATCPLVLDPGVVSAAATQVRTTDGLKADLTGAMLDLDAKLLQFGKLAAGSRKLRAYLGTAAY